MITPRQLLSFTLAVGALFAVPAHSGPPRTFNQDPPPQQQLGSSIAIKPNQEVWVKFDIDNGELLNFVTGFDVKTTENVLKVRLDRRGGNVTSLGPTSPITDVLTITCSQKRAFSARCAYRTLNAPGKLEQYRISDRTGEVKKSFRWGVSEVVISEFKLAKPPNPSAEKSRSVLPAKGPGA